MAKHEQKFYKDNKRNFRYPGNVVFQASNIYWILIGMESDDTPVEKITPICERDEDKQMMGDERELIGWWRKEGIAQTSTAHLLERRNHQYDQIR